MRKRTIFLSLIITSFFLFGMNPPKTSAHSASSMNLSYAFSAQELTVTITHGVSTPSTHYIETVTIRVNGTTDTQEVYTSQPTTSTFMYQYNITAGNGAIIQVTSVCNLAGMLTRTLTVIDPTAKPGSFTLSTDAGDPDNNGNFNLIWTPSLAADNYSVYSHTSLITQINLTLNPLSDQAGVSPLLVQNFSNGTYYFVVEAHNKNGDRLSNVESVSVLILPSNGGLQPSIPGYNLIWILGLSALAIGILFKRIKKTKL
ncbi:MAG: hypothetical protein ACFFD7_11605 [Candidatus Thorarchaeota archaeon]